MKQQKMLKNNKDLKIIDVTSNMFIDYLIGALEIVLQRKS